MIFVIDFLESFKDFLRNFNNLLTKNWGFLIDLPIHGPNFLKTRIF